ncbi:MAG TPA: DNA polymerase III subunit delta [Woeseiaceae bacterium]|nr:DNA polymerase III subunit delta [Woeseiaceae bacterium]
MNLTAKQLSAHLKKNLASCYLISGDEHLLVDEVLDRIRHTARERGFISREVYVATDSFDWSQLAAAGANLSLFADQRILELRLPTGKPGRAGSQAIADFAAQMGPELLLLVRTPKLDRNSAKAKWVQALTKEGVHIAIWPIDLRELPGWIGARMRAAGLQPDQGAVQMIADRVEGNLLAASQEIEKLRLLLGAGRVTSEDVGHAVADSSRFDVYKLADAALAGDAKRAIRILAGLRREGVLPVLVAWSLTRELRGLAKVSEQLARKVDLMSAMRKAGIWSSKQDLVRAAVGRHSYASLLGLLQAAGRTDAAAKGQSGDDPWQLSADIVLRLALGPIDTCTIAAA